MKVGDLVCYNAAGQKHKSIGLLLEIDPPRYHYGSQDKAVLIQWCVVGEIMPRRDHRDGWIPGDIESGMMVWHPFGPWFEVVK